MSFAPPALRLRLIFRAEQSVAMPAFPGQTWRGLFGRAYRELVCATGADQCAGCILIDHCSYPLLFEEGLSQRLGVDARYTAPPRPFVIEPESIEQREVAAGDTLTLRLLLIGHAMTMAPYVIAALQRGVRGGFGRRRSRLELLTVEAEQNGRYEPLLAAEDNRGIRFTPVSSVTEPPEPPETIRMVFETPLRLKHQRRLVGAREFHPTLLINNLQRRLSVLADCYAEPISGLPPILPPPEGPQPNDTGLRWKEFTRHSARQQRDMTFGGLVGAVTLDLRGLQSYWPLLWAGQFFHAGNEATFGLGQYRIECL